MMVIYQILHRLFVLLILFSLMKFIIWLLNLTYRFLLMFQNIPAMLMQLVCCVFWKRLGFLDLLKKRKFIRLLQANCTVKLKKYLKMKLLLFIPTALMLLPNSMVFGSQRNIVRHMVCLPVTAFYLTTNRNAAAKTL